MKSSAWIIGGGDGGDMECVKIVILEKLVYEYRLFVWLPAFNVKILNIISFVKFYQLISGKN